MAVEAWSSGTIKMEIDGAYLPVEASVECMRIGVLVQVLARADALDPAFRDVFPIVATRIERFSVLSLARDPLAEIGQACAHDFINQVGETIRRQLLAREIAKAEFEKLQAATAEPSHPE